MIVSLRTLALTAALLAPGIAMAQTSAPAARMGTAPSAPASASAGTMPSCPGDAVVWVNTRSKVEHAQGSRYFGKTHAGKYMCQKAADAEGDHMAKNGQ